MGHGQRLAASVSPESQVLGDEGWWAQLALHPLRFVALAGLIVSTHPAMQRAAFSRSTRHDFRIKFVNMVCYICQ